MMAVAVHESPAALLLTAALVATLLIAIAVSRRWRLRERFLRQELETYLNLSAAMIIVIDDDGVLHNVNQRTCEILGRDRASLIGVNFVEDIVVGQERGASRASLAEVRETENERGTRRRTVRAADGQERLIEFEFTRHDTGAGHVVVASGHDVTELEAGTRQIARLRELARDVAAHDDARPAIVDHARALTGAATVAIVEFGVVTAAAGAERPAPDLSVIATVTGGRRPVTTATHAYEPVLVDGVVAAVLVLGFDGARPDDADLVALLAEETAIALRRLAALRNLQDAALTDALTGVANRRQFDHELPLAFARAKRGGYPLALAALDLNEFKPLNDTEGHEAGDRLLKATASAWLAELRATDLLARTGGDEFFVVLPDCQDTALVTRRLREACPHGPGAGVGVVVWDGRETPEDLMRRADAALYADKRRPRGRALDDAERLAAADAARLLSGGDTSVFDDLTRVARWLLDVPSVAFTAVTPAHQHTVAQCVTGDALDDAIPISHSYCQHTVTSGRPLVTRDARQHPLLRGNPAIDDGVIAYAGLPLFDADGLPVAVLCAFDSVPRDWSDDELATMRRLAVRAEAELAARATASI